MAALASPAASARMSEASGENTSKHLKSRLGIAATCSKPISPLQSNIVTFAAGSMSARSDAVIPFPEHMSRPRPSSHT
eukprot:CAMPEP_0180315218 /NCGR_PEP_ID=MMETSP0988-20121125/32525_1 /TAXON_ID=697907 /ORGANISM="non described non described, Strain CCMP2293" /LENGTH=77 /DNA_ID=CAMNT_0022300069 /DNA_START=213 /DNA_END=446 /DNA_ORIENTATION=+